MDTKDLKRRALGKGLEALLPGRLSRQPENVAPPSAPSPENLSGRPREVLLTQIDRNPFQTRSSYDPEQLAELAASIKASGVVQPVLLRPIADGRYQLIAGERRFLASQKVGNTSIPAILRQVSDEQALEMTIIENLQRTDLNPMEQARAYDRLGREFKMTQEKIAVRTGKDRASIANFLRLLRLPPLVQTRVEGGELSFGHARTLLALDSHQAILKAAEKVSALAMSVRQTETYVQGLLHPEKKQRESKLKEPLDPNVRDARDRMQRALGLRVNIQDKDGRGRVIIEYSRLEDFDKILDTVLGDFD